MSDVEHGEQIELSAPVSAIRRQLTEAARQGADESVHFEVGPIQMEFTVELTHEAGARGGVRAWVLSAGADARASRGTTHRVSLTLTPRDAATGSPVEIGNTPDGGTSRFGAGG